MEAAAKLREVGIDNLAVCACAFQASWFAGEKKCVWRMYAAKMEKYGEAETCSSQKEEEG